MTDSLKIIIIIIKKIFTEVTGLRSEAQGTYEPNIVQKLKKFLIFIASCTWQRKIEDYKYSGGNKCHFCQIFVAELELLPIRIIQSKASANTHEYSEKHQVRMT